MAEKLNLFQKLSKIRAMSDVIKKDKKGFNYTYADITAILANITAGMKKYGVSLIPMIKPQTATVSQVVMVNTKVDKTGQAYDCTTTEMLVRADMDYVWVNDETPEERIVVPWIITGMQSDPSQALGSGLTYCERYFLCNYFQIAQSDTDVDTYRSKQKAAELLEDESIAKGIIGNFDSILKQYLSDYPDSADDIKAFVGRYAKNADYLKIKDQHLAAKLLKDFQEKYLNKFSDEKGE